MNPPQRRLTPFLVAAAVAAASLLTRHPLPLVVLLIALLPLAPRPRWPIAAFAAVGFVMNGLFSWYGATELWVADFRVPLMGRPRLTAEALASGGATAVQVAVATVALLIAFARTAPQALARLMPGAGPRLATGVALRAVPDFARDARAIRHGMAVRGLETRGVRGASHLLVPLVARSLDRAATTIEVLYARGAGARPRSAVPVRWTAWDVLAVATLGVLFAAWAAGVWPEATYLPRLALAPATDPVTWLPALPALLLPGVLRRD